MGGPMGSQLGSQLGEPPSRALIVHHLPPDVTYEELFDAVGAYGNLESIKLLGERRQAFINFVEPQSAFLLMMSCNGQIVLGGKQLTLMYAKMRPLPRDLVAAIRQGATRNLYVANVPENLTGEVAGALFAPFGDLESVRLVSRKRAAFVNYANVTAALKAKEAMHCKVLARERRLRGSIHMWRRLRMRRLRMPPRIPAGAAASATLVALAALASLTALCAAEWSPRLEEGGIFEQRLARHDAVRLGMLQAAHHVCRREDASVGEDGHRDGRLDICDVVPVGHTLLYGDNTSRTYSYTRTLNF
jgi:hypothetical protein